MSEKNYIVTMPDGSEWAMPLRVIANSYLENHKHEAKTIDEVLELFDLDSWRAFDYAQNNMNWWSIREHAEIVKPRPNDVDYQEGWVNGEARIE